MATENDNLVMLILFHEGETIEHRDSNGMVRHSLGAPMQLTVAVVPLHKATLEVASANYAGAVKPRFLKKVAIDPLNCDIYPKEVPFGIMTKQLQMHWPHVWLMLEKELEQAGTLKEWLMKCIT